MPQQFRSSNDLRRKIEPELRDAETLVWVGQPDPAQFSREVQRACLCQLGLFAVTALFVCAITYVVDSEKTARVGLLASAVTTGYFLLAAPWRYPYKVLQTIYGITDRRAIVYRGVGWSSRWLEALPDLHDMVWSFDPNLIRARRRIRRYSGRTNLVFDGERHFYETGRGQIQDWVQVGFLGLANINEIDQLLETRFPYTGVPSREEV
jgi:hypothetical protein